MSLVLTSTINESRAGNDQQFACKYDSLNIVGIQKTSLLQYDATEQCREISRYNLALCIILFVVIYIVNFILYLTKQHLSDLYCTIIHRVLSYIFLATNKHHKIIKIQKQNVQKNKCNCATWTPSKTWSMNYVHR